MMRFKDMRIVEADVLVLGGGLAGHRAAVAARAAGAAVALAYHARGASQHIIGFNVPLGDADPRDSADAYYEDMVRGGYALNERRLVRALADGAKPAFAELEALGVPFARERRQIRAAPSVRQHLRALGVPPERHRQVWRWNGSSAIALQSACRLTPAGSAIALLRDGADVVGALLAKRNADELMAIHAGATVLATGGIGAIYADSTYPADVAADSYAFAFDAGATLIDMEFVQFEPTIVVHPQGCKGMEMPTAMLGDGAHLVNADGERFMFRYNPGHGRIADREGAHVAVHPARNR